MKKKTKNRKVTLHSLDTARLQWLSTVAKVIEGWDEDCFLSYHKDRRQIGFYVHGKYTLIKGEDLRDATDKAMAHYFKLLQDEQ